MAEMKAKAAAARFGELYEISKADWVREVTDASKSVTVVAHLYEDGIVECRVMEVCSGKKLPFVGPLQSFACADIVSVSLGGLLCGTLLRRSIVLFPVAMRGRV